MHTDQTLKILDGVTIEIGSKFRAFSNKTCSAFDTRELSRETAARKRRRLQKMKDKKVSTDLPSALSVNHLSNSTGEVNGARSKRFNLHIYKYHCLGDYPNMIRRFGTTDSFSTEPVSGFST
jgi:hypothetical protein